MKTLYFILALAFLASCSEQKEIAAYSAQYAYTIYDGNMSAIYYTNEVRWEGGAIIFVDHLGVERSCSEYTWDRNR